MRGLTEYNRKRKFQETSEPIGRVHSENNPIFVVQRHAASRLHFDFRLQVNGALASWAVPKGPPQERGEKRLAIHVEDHPIEYAKFEGDIPKGNYGAGHVDIWDKGTFEIEGAESAASQIEKGDLKFTLKGDRLKGRYALVKMRNASRGNEWLFIRKTDPLTAAGNPAVVERLGQPVDPVRPFPGGSVTTDGNRGEAMFYFDVAGPKGAAKVSTKSRLLEGKWGFTQLELEFPDGKRLQLAQSSRQNTNDDTPKFDPTATQADVKQPDLPVDIKLPDLPEMPKK